jgi:enamine deaminase RidA (YjgF/YER057c/UK114 family)
MTKAGMSQGVRYGDCITVAGQVAYDDEGRLVGPGDARAQSVQCFANVSRVLGQLGATMDDLVEVVCFLDSREYLDDYLAVRREVFSTDHPPATTTVIAAMGRPGILVEVKAVAAIGEWKTAP